jgi:hypothetical protein
MDAWLWILIAAVVVVILFLIFGLGTRRRTRARSARLRDRFGPEYDHVVADDSRRDASWTPPTTVSPRPRSSSMR